MRNFRNRVVSLSVVIFFAFLSFNLLDARADVIIDNGQPGTSYTGTWGVSGGLYPYGTNSLWSRDGATYTWQFSSQPAGTYEVYMWWSEYNSRATNIAVDITHRDGTSRVYINQQQNAGTWNSLGQYYFDSSGSVRIIAAYGSTVSTCADAVWFQHISSNIPPTAYIDSITPNPALPGETVSFSGHGTDADGNIAAYQWESSINGLLSNLASFSKSDLSAGTHTISFRVQDNEGAWSAPVTQTLVVGTIPTEVIIDNRDVATSQTGSWWISGATNPYGADSVWSRDGYTFTFHFTPTQTGNYELSMWWSTWPSRSNNVPVDIQYSGGTTRLYINQQLNGGIWNFIGTYPFEAGASYRVTITSSYGSTVSTCADAVKFVYVSGSAGNTPPTAYIDSISPNPALPGETVSFAGHGTDIDGTITAYNWRSSIDGVLSTSATFSTSSLSEGIHIIYFNVQDDQDAWSPETRVILGYRGCSSPVRIMPLGDSITFGRNDPALEPVDPLYYPHVPNYVTGYRQPLYLSLLNAGYYVDFVGSLHDGELAEPVFDIDHHGVLGALDSDIANNVYNYLSQNPADIILLHIGTNSLDTNPGDVENILKEIDRYEQDNSRNIMVVLARIINRKTYSLTTTQFNNNVQAMAEGRIANGDEIVIVDQESALDYANDMWDNLHPNNSGYNKMADVWFNGLNDFLPVCEQFAPFIFTYPVTSAIVGEPYTYHVQAIGKPSPTYTFDGVPPSGMTIDSNTGLISWTPFASGSFNVIVKASNGVGSSSIQSFTIEVYGTYTIAATAGSGGSISPSGAISVSQGANQTFTITPNTGYHIADVLVDGSSAGAVTSYTFNNIVDNHTIEAFFALNTGIQEIIIDNGQPGTSYTGTWGVSGGLYPYGTNSLWSRDGATYTWQINSQPAGIYEVYMWWSEYKSRATNIAVDITHRDGKSTVYINQQLDAGKWNKLGEYYFDGTGRVTIIAAYGSTVSTCADAVKFVHVSGSGGNIPPTAYIDSISPNPAEAGQTIEFRGHGTDSDGSVIAYRWESSIDGLLSTSGIFTSSSLTAGTHTISFRVQDNEGAWSEPVTEVLVIGSVSTEVIIDNRDAATSQTGTWDVSGAADPYGVDSVWSRDGTTFTWHFVPPQSGNYELSMWWTTWSSRSNNIPVDIEYYGGTTRVYINQQLNGGRWNVLGTYPFEAGISYRVTITSQPGPSSTCADAVRFVYIPGGNIAPTATIDLISPNPALPGETVSFAGSGTDSDGTITGYNWRSSIDGQLSSSASFSTSALSEGNHVIYFKVQDNQGAWSQEASRTAEIANPIADPNTEHIFVCLLYFAASDKPDLISFLQNEGAYKDGDVWKYESLAQGKTYIIHIIEDIESMKQALYTENAHMIMTGHANYGLGGVFIPDYTRKEQVTNNIFYIDDDKIFNYSSPWIHVSVYGLIESQAYPNWWPVFKDGTNGIMPYDFGDPQGDPPYNYFVTYQVPGDPTYYKIETVRNSARMRFPDSNRPAWYSPDGSLPDPSNYDHLQYYITNTDLSFESIGKWIRSRSDTGYYGSHYCYTSAGQGDKLVRWNFSIPEAGNYDVFAWWPSSASNTVNALYTVTHSSGSITVTKNQTVSGGQWNKLGEFYFDPGEYSITLTDATSAGNVVADAVKITHRDNPAVFDTTIDNLVCPKSHYGSKTILFRKELEIELVKLKYKRMLYDSCSVGTYYLDTFNRGVMFYTVASSNTRGIYRYLKAYWEEKSDQEIWQILQAYQPLYDYYYFDKLPSEQ
ncbi:MAG: putative Ig domain-containing protein [Nitrospirae bacterium]|nr:putative Ig domain-containing protein [Nitrospirota bacterium]